MHQVFWIKSFQTFSAISYSVWAYIRCTACPSLVDDVSYLTLEESLTLSKGTGKHTVRVPWWLWSFSAGGGLNRLTGELQRVVPGWRAAPALCVCVLPEPSSREKWALLEPCRRSHSWDWLRYLRRESWPVVVCQERIQSCGLAGAVGVDCWSWLPAGRWRQQAGDAPSVWDWDTRVGIPAASHWLVLVRFREMREVEEILRILLDIDHTAIQVTCRKSVPAVQIQENYYTDGQMNKAFWDKYWGKRLWRVLDSYQWMAFVITLWIPITPYDEIHLEHTEYGLQTWDDYLTVPICI